MTGHRRWPRASAIVAAACTLVFTSVVVAGQRGAPPPTRDAATPATPRTGTAVIAGTIISDDADARPVRRARVVLESGLIEMPRSVVTDDAGRFTFTALPAGNYTLSALKSGYVTVSHGAKRPGDRPGTAIAIRDGQRVDVAVRMPRGAVITGTVRGPGGRALSGVNINVTAVRTTGGRRTTLMMTTPANAQTDDRGIYRVYGLAPGEYIVHAQVRLFGFGPASSGRRPTAEELAWADRQLKAATGAVPSGLPATPPDPGPSVTFAPVFYPGTTDASAAAVVPVSSGEERSGVDLTIEYVPTSRVSGTIAGPDGRPLPRVQFTLMPLTTSDADPLARFMGAFSVRYMPDGTFVAENVTPGRYELTARAAVGGAATQPSSPLALVGLTGRMGGGPVPTLWAREELDIRGRDVTGLSMQLQQGMTMTGRVILKAATRDPFPLTNMSVMLAAVPDAEATQQAAIMAMAMGGSATGAVKEDGAFQVEGILPGRYRVAPVAPGMLPIAVPGVQVPTTWMVVSLSAGGRDILDLPIDIRPNEHLNDVVITITDQITELSGTVYDQAGRPTPAFPIVAFATDRAFWAPGSRRIQQARPASDGRYRLEALPPGEYYICAVTDLDPNDLADPAFLEQLTAGSFRISIGPGEKKVQDLKLAGG